MSAPTRTHLQNRSFDFIQHPQVRDKCQPELASIFADPDGDHPAHSDQRPRTSAPRGPRAFPWPRAPPPQTPRRPVPAVQAPVGFGRIGPAPGAGVPGGPRSAAAAAAAAPPRPRQGPGEGIRATRASRRPGEPTSRSDRSPPPGRVFAVRGPCRAGPPGWGVSRPGPGLVRRRTPAQLSRTRSRRRARPRRHRKAHLSRLHRSARGPRGRGGMEVEWPGWLAGWGGRDPCSRDPPASRLRLRACRPRGRSPPRRRSGRRAGKGGGG
jgi:hypothetical protein